MFLLFLLLFRKKETPITTTQQSSLLQKCGKTSQREPQIIKFQNAFHIWICEYNIDCNILIYNITCRVRARLTDCNLQSPPSFTFRMSWFFVMLVFSILKLFEHHSQTNFTIIKTKPFKVAKYKKGCLGQSGWR